MKNRLRSRDGSLFLTTFLYGPLKCLCQFSVGYLIWTGVFAPLCSVCQAGTLWQLCFRQEASLGACSAYKKDAFLQVNRTLQEKQDK